jgi:hypothetical protein
MPHTDQRDEPEKDSRSARSGESESGRLRSLSQRHSRPGQQMERGEKRPQGASLKLLSLVERKGPEIVA